jgi:deoxycytidylate deaminase
MSKDIVPPKPEHLFEDDYVEKIYKNFNESELVMGIVAAIGTNTKEVIDCLKNQFKCLGYQIEHIKISKFFKPSNDTNLNTEEKMDFGDRIRKDTKDNGILAYLVCNHISIKRMENANKKVVYLVDSLKRPEEALILKRVYNGGFFLIGSYASEATRKEYLTRFKKLSVEESSKLMGRDYKDRNKQIDWGQNVQETYELSDFFVTTEWGVGKLENQINRITNLIFGNPYFTPTQDEYAMFTAYATSLNSADLSRNVGACIMNQFGDIIATGYNDVPKYEGGGGGLCTSHHKEGIYTEDSGRDQARGVNPNKEQVRLHIDSVVDTLKKDFKGLKNVDNQKIEECLKKTVFSDAIEFMRSAHAESSAIVSCARNGISIRGAILYATTFPCHECAKRIVNAGISRVVFIEAYPKSQTLSMFREFIRLDFKETSGMIRLEPFIGVGPRRYIDMFALRFGSGYPTKRETKEGHTIPFEGRDSFYVRTPMYPFGYVERENIYKEVARKVIEGSGKPKDYENILKNLETATNDYLYLKSDDYKKKKEAFKPAN